MSTVFRVLRTPPTPSITDTHIDTHTEREYLRRVPRVPTITGASPGPDVRSSPTSTIAASLATRGHQRPAEAAVAARPAVATARATPPHHRINAAAPQPPNKVITYPQDAFVCLIGSLPVFVRPADAGRTTPEMSERPNGPSMATRPSHLPSPLSVGRRYRRDGQWAGQPRIVSDNGSRMKLSTRARGFHLTAGAQWRPADVCAAIAALRRPRRALTCRLTRVAPDGPSTPTSRRPSDWLEWAAWP